MLTGLKRLQKLDRPRLVKRSRVDVWWTGAMSRWEWVARFALPFCLTD
jgi:hypothetical protein